MAKELPYFKFEPGQWENGSIQMATLEQQGAFINICSMYWQRLGDLPYKLAVQKACKGNATALDSLIEDDIIRLIDGSICIDFLNEQLNEFENVSDQNRINALKRWEKHRKDATALQPQIDPNAIREEKIKEEKKKVDKKVFTPPTLDEVKLFFQEKKFPESLAIRAFEHYDIAGWKDTNGNKVRNWKQKMLSVWMKDENKNYNGKNTSGSSTQLAALRVESKPFGSFKLSPPNGAGNS
jgi:hypothetical protein